MDTYVVKYKGMLCKIVITFRIVVCQDGEKGRQKGSEGFLVGFNYISKVVFPLEHLRQKP